MYNINESIVPNVEDCTDEEKLEEDLDSELIMAIINNDLERARELIEKGADVDAIDNEGNSALYLAASINHFDMVELLIAKGCEVNNSEGYCRALDATENEYMIKLLLDNGALRSIDYYDSCLFSMESVNSSIISFDDSFREEVFYKILEKYNIEKTNFKEKLIEIYNSEDDTGEYDDLFCDLEEICFEVDSESAEFTGEAIDCSGWNITDLFESLGYEVKFEGYYGGIEGDVGVYFID